MGDFTFSIQRSVARVHLATPAMGVKCTFKETRTAAAGSCFCLKIEPAAAANAAQRCWVGNFAEVRSD